MIAQVESYNSALLVESPKDLVEQLQRFDAACSMALSEHDSLNLIREYLKAYDDECHS